MYWTKELSYIIAPKSGPMRKMQTLLDANRAMSKDLPFGYLRRKHWLIAGESVVNAAETGAENDIRLATDELLKALEAEGWMTRAPRPGDGLGN
jgi:hypothetical protein